MKFDRFTDGFYDTENLVPEYVRRIADSYFTQELQEKQTVSTVAEHERRVNRLKSLFLTSIGGLYDSKPSLEAKKPVRSQEKNLSSKKSSFRVFPGCM